MTIKNPIILIIINHYKSYLNSSFKETVLKLDQLQENNSNTMDTDALALCVARLSGTKVLTIQNKCLFAFHEEGFQIPTPILGGEMVACKYFSGFLKEMISICTIQMKEQFQCMKYN